MGLVAWNCAHADPPPTVLSVAATVPIAPPDDSVDTNNITITGAGTISSFGTGPAGILITKKVTFVASGGAITVAHTPPGLVLMGAINHVVASGKSCIGHYQWDGASKWVEQDFSDPSNPPPNGALLPSGTVMLFVQATAPVGWTKLTTQDDTGLRLVSGSTGGQAHGSGSFAGTFNPGDHGTTTASASNYTVQPWDGTGSQFIFNATDSHSHTVSIPIAYVDVIQASKN